MADKAKSAMKPPAAEPKKTDKKEEPPDMLNKGQVIAAKSGNQYVVERQLGKGGFGEVYKVYPADDPEKSYAMKVEPMICKPGHETFLRLKIELYVFDTIAASTKVDKTHFVKMHDKGKTLVFKYYVMDLIWLSLKEAIEKVCKNQISPATKITIARQTLQGIEALHELGFLHRDIKCANYAVGLPPKENIIYLLDFGISRPYRDEKTGEVKLPRAKVPFLGTTKYASCRSMECQDQGRRDDLEVWMYMMLDIYDKKNLWWAKTKENKEILKLKYRLQNEARESQKSGALKVPEGFVDIMNKIKMMDYYSKGDFRWIDSQLDVIVKQDKINMDVPLEWVGKKEKSPEKPKREPRPKMQPESSEKKATPSKMGATPSKMGATPSKIGAAPSKMGATPTSPADWQKQIAFLPPDYVTHSPTPYKEKKDLIIANNSSQTVAFKMKSSRPVFRMSPVFFIIPPNAKRTVQLTFKGIPHDDKPLPKQDRYTAEMAIFHKGSAIGWGSKEWQDEWKELAKCKKRKVLKVHYEGCEIPVADKNDEDDKEEEPEIRRESMKTGRKKESKKRKKESRKKSGDLDPEEVVITMEALKDELMREKRRRMKSKERTSKEKDDYWDDDEDEDSEDDYSDRDDDYRRRRKGPKGRKKRSRERTVRTRDVSDREDRDDMDDRDERDDRRRNRPSAEGEKRASKEKFDDNDDEPVSVVGQEIKNLEPSVKKGKDRKRAKDEKGSKEKTLEAPPPDDGAYMVLGDANDMEKVQDSKEKIEGDAKKDQKSPVASPSQMKKADEAAPGKKEPVDAKKK